MKIVITFGMAFKVTDTKYKELMKDIANNKDIDIDDYGKPLGLVMNITDMSSEEAKEILRDMI